MGFRVNTAGKVQQGHFARVPATVNAPRSAFDRSSVHKTTINSGLLYPLFWEPVLPGDTLNLTMNVLLRLLTPIFPYMDNLYLDVHWFFVPDRLLWNHWEQFQGAVEPDDTTEYEYPSLDDATHAAGFAQDSIYDYFGIPTKIPNIPQDDMPIAAPLRAYNKIVNDWYRDENYQDSLVLDKSDGPDTTNYQLFRRNRRKDYFTSCLPWPQKGPSVPFPIGSTAPVVSNGENFTMSRYDGAGTPNQTMAYNGSAVAVYSSNPGLGTDQKLKWGNESGLEADLSAAAGSTVNAWREAVVLQQMLELDARGGTRYVEAILARFGVVSPDFRLQRSEYIGGQTMDVNVNPIAQTSQSGDLSDPDATPQGNLAGFAAARGRSSAVYSCQEHGHIIAMVSVRADTTYQQGLSRHWSRRTRHDFYEPLAANLGEQAVLNKEIYMQGPVTPPAKGDNDVYGYQERWAEYRYRPGMVTGAFRSNYTGSLDAWHLAVDFDSLPTAEDVIPENPPVQRIVAVQNEPEFQCDTWTRFRHVRVMPIYSAPGLTRL